MHITRKDDAPTEGAKHDPGNLEDLTLKGLQWELTKLTGRDTVEKDKSVLIRRITELRQQKEVDAKAKADAEQPPEPSIEELQRQLNALTGRKVVTRDRAVLSRMISKLESRKADVAASTPDSAAQTVTERLVAIANMKLPELRETYRTLFGKVSLSRNRKALLVKIAEKLQADAAASESPAAPVAKPTLTVKFERKGGRKAAGKAKGLTKAKPATKGKETAVKRTTTRPAGQRDPRLPKAGTTIERLYKGKKLLVTVTENGFTFNGKPYRSLSALAMAITGSAAINGYLFFQLGKYAKKEKAGK